MSDIKPYFVPASWKYWPIAVLLFFPLQACISLTLPTATITLTPDQTILNNHYVFTGIQGAPDPAERQIAIRQITATVPAQARTSQATGHGQTPGSAAQGSLTFFNGTSAEQTIPKGSSITFKDLTILTDADAHLPPGNPPAPMPSTSVPAHLAQIGSSGNLPAKAFSQTCCKSNAIYVQNNAFSGGKDPQSFSLVTQQDIDQAMSPLIQPLKEQAQQALQTQIHTGEQLTSEPQCFTPSSSNVAVGAQATTVTVFVSARCTGLVYDQQGALTLGENLLKQEVSKQLSTIYTLTDQLASTVAATTIKKQGQFFVTVAVSGTWRAHLNQSLEQALTKQIAGKTSKAAQSLLLASGAIKQARIQLFPQGQDTLPTDIHAIKMIVTT